MPTRKLFVLDLILFSLALVLLAFAGWLDAVLRAVYFFERSGSRILVSVPSLLLGLVVLNHAKRNQQSLKPKLIIWLILSALFFLLGLVALEHVYGILYTAGSMIIVGILSLVHAYLITVLFVQRFNQTKDQKRLMTRFLSMGIIVSLIFALLFYGLGHLASLYTSQPFYSLVLQQAHLSPVVLVALTALIMLVFGSAYLEEHVFRLIPVRGYAHKKDNTKLVLLSTALWTLWLGLFYYNGFKMTFIDILWMMSWLWPLGLILYRITCVVSQGNLVAALLNTTARIMILLFPIYQGHLILAVVLWLVFILSLRIGLSNLKTAS